MLVRCGWGFNAFCGNLSPDLPTLLLLKSLNICVKYQDKAQPGHTADKGDIGGDVGKGGGG